MSRNITSSDQIIGVSDTLMNRLEGSDIRVLGLFRTRFPSSQTPTHHYCPLGIAHAALIPIPTWHITPLTKSVHRYRLSKVSRYQTKIADALCHSEQDSPIASTPGANNAVGWQFQTSRSDLDQWRSRASHPGAMADSKHHKKDHGGPMPGISIAQSSTDPAGANAAEAAP